MDPKVAAALDRLDEASTLPIREYRDSLADELCLLTRSEISYIAAINPDETLLTMVGWSRSAMTVCAITEKPIVYNLEDTGLWGDAVRERNICITNDYANSKRATKRGYPAGHVRVSNHMNLPIFDGDKVVAVVGVGNKPNDYTMDDARLIEDLMYEVWPNFSRSLWDATW